MVDAGKVVAVPLAISKTGFAMVRKKASDSMAALTPDSRRLHLSPTDQIFFLIV